MARSLEGKCKRRSDTSSSDEESKEESSEEEEKERGTKPAPAANATESTQQKLDRLWVTTANAWDCNVRLTPLSHCTQHLLLGWFPGICGKYNF